jgi:hypothetical protein
MTAARPIQVFALHAAAALWLAAAIAAAQEAGDSPKPNLLDEMTSLAEPIKVKLADGEREADRLANPVFRYDDQPRRILDATLWVWMDGSRPVAFQKIEAVDRGRPKWSFYSTSFSTQLIEMEWPGNRRYRSTEPGIVYRAVPGAPAVAQANIQRKRQMRELARQFTARIVLADDSSAEMRLLTTPICEFTDTKTKLFEGAIFGFGTNGTNPDLLLALESREENGRLLWCFAPARITTNGIRLNHQDQQVWETPHENYKEAPFSNWTCFGIPRQPAVPETESE